MDTYLLLRSNKQSGPYSLQQLVSFGLKPYDLVWVEGKSAAWRYPSEVDLLKDYAPATEEQPYDRFYKKAEEQPADQPVQKQENKPVQKQEEIYVLPKEETYVLPVEHKTITTSKKVFVSMPGNHIPKKPVEPVQVKAPKIIEEKPAIIEERKIESKPILVKEEPVIVERTPSPKQEPVKTEKIVSPKEEPTYYDRTVSIKEEPVLNEKYSESLDDIKRRYTETYLSRKKKSKWTSTHTSLVQVFGGAIFFCLLVVFAYKNFSGEETQSKTTVIQPDKRSINTSTLTNTPTTIPAAVTETQKQHPVRKTQKVKEIDPPDESLAINTKQQKKNVVSTEDEINASDYEPEQKAVMTKSIEEPKIEPVRPKTRPVNISRLVNVRANNYKQRAFGGVTNLELTVNNDSKFELDKVIVELQYLKPSEQPIKTERIVFNSIEPNGSQTLKIPDYLRGIKVAYRVTSIESSQYERQTAGL